MMHDALSLSIFMSRLQEDLDLDYRRTPATPDQLQRIRMFLAREFRSYKAAYPIPIVVDGRELVGFDANYSEGGNALKVTGRWEGPPTDQRLQEARWQRVWYISRRLP